MTDKEKAIVMAYTGVCMLKGNKLQIFYEYVEHLLHFPVMTHQLPLFAEDIKKKATPDFIALCINDSTLPSSFQEYINNRFQTIN